MADIEKIIEGLNLPKQIIDKSEALFKALFSASIGEWAGMISDQVRLRRFKNQVAIFEKAQKIIKDKGIDPKSISLKVLAPLIEFSSLEEDTLLQEKWSNLISNILTKDLSINFQQNAISILNKLSNQEALIIDFAHSEFVKWQSNQYNKAVKSHNEWLKNERDKHAKELEGLMSTSELNSYLSSNTPNLDDYKYDYLSFAVQLFIDKFNFTESVCELALSNLVALGILKWDTLISARADNRYDEIDIDVNVDDFTTLRFTKLGFEFSVLCNS